MTLAALLYALAALGPIALHTGLLFGAPWGHLTMGGRFSGGPLPPKARPFAAFQGIVLVLMALTVLDHADLVPLGWPDGAIWSAVAITILTTIANLITPSRPERALWGPVTLVMSAAILWVAFA